MLGDESTRANNPVVGSAVDDEILHDRERTNTEWLDGDGLAILKLAHIDLAGCSATRPLRNTIDHHVACSADALAAIARKRNRLLAFLSQAVVHDVEHLQEGTLGGDFRGVNFDEFAFIGGGLLLPESEMKIHGAHSRKS